MKKLLFAFFLLTTFTTTFSQKIIKLDFKDKTIDSLNQIEHLKLGELYKIEIDHVVSSPSLGTIKSRVFC